MVTYSKLNLNSKVYYVFKKGNDYTLFQDSDEFKVPVFKVPVYQGGLSKLNNSYLNKIRKQNAIDAKIFHYDVLTDGSLILKRMGIVAGKKK
jgi:hypothetical protein